jgi:hypothetical protein
MEQLGLVLEQAFLQLKDYVLLGMELDGLLVVMEETHLPILAMGLTGRVVDQAFLQQIQEALVGTEVLLIPASI